MAKVEYTPIEVAIDRCADRIANRWFGESAAPSTVKALYELAKEELQALAQAEEIVGLASIKFNIVNPLQHREIK